MKTKLAATFGVALLVCAAASGALADGNSRYGREIRTAQVSGYTLTYTLIDTAELNLGTVMPLASYDGGRTPSHHLMVFVRDAAGRAVTEGTVSFAVTTPNGTVSTLAGRPMNGGFGNDVELPARGELAIQVKLALPNADLTDAFAHAAN